MYEHKKNGTWYYSLNDSDKQILSDVMKELSKEIDEQQWFSAGYNIATKLKYKEMDVISAKQLSVLHRLFSYFNIDFRDILNEIPIYEYKSN